jgi:hypothetical protein
MTFHKLRAIEWVWFLVMLVIGRVWIRFDQELFASWLLMPAFNVLVLLLMAAFFMAVRPARPFALARTMSVALIVAVGALIVLQHVILTFDLTYKSGIILCVTAIMPFVVAAGYKRVSRQS